MFASLCGHERCVEALLLAGAEHAHQADVRSKLPGPTRCLPSCLMIILPPCHNRF